MLFEFDEIVESLREERHAAALGVLLDWLVEADLQACRDLFAGLEEHCATLDPSQRAAIVCDGFAGLWAGVPLVRVKYEQLISLPA